MQHLPAWISLTANLASADVLADTASTLILLGGGVLVFRTFRERYLVSWIIGWALYLYYRVSAEDITATSSRWLLVSCRAAFILAVCLFAASVLYFLRKQRFLWVIGILGFISLEFAVAHDLTWPNSVVLIVGAQIACYLISSMAGIQLAMFSRGRMEFGPWLMSIALICLHMDRSPVEPHAFIGFDTMVEVVLGLSMLVLVLDESRAKGRRLRVMNIITDATANARDVDAMMVTALRELRRLMQARFAWFRLREGDYLILRRALNIPEESLLKQIPPQAIFGDAESSSKRWQPVVSVDAALLPNPRYGVDHVLGIPVSGKNSIIGTIALARTSPRTYVEEETTFLSTVAKQIGIAIENLLLMEKESLSQRQWANTFDAMPDPILVHDKEFRIVKANRALLVRLGRTAEDVLTKTAEEILPKKGGPWKGCPYCNRSQDWQEESHDPILGGYSVVTNTSYSDPDAGQSGTVHIIRDTTAKHAAEERYRSLFEQVQEGVFVSTPEGRVLECNDAFLRMLGCETREELQSLDVASTFYANPEDRKSYRELIEKQGFVRNFEFTVRRRDGSTIHVMENSYARTNLEGRIERYHGVLMDVSEKRKSEDQIRRRNRELEVLNTIAVVANQSFDLDEIVNVALRQLVDLFGADSGGVYLVNTDAKEVKRCAAYGQSADIPLSEEVGFSEELWGQIRAMRCEALTEHELELLPPEYKQRVEREGLKSWVWVLMWTAEKLVGAMTIGSRKASHFRDIDRKLAIAIGRQLANSLDRVRLYEETMRAYENLRRTQEQLLQSEKMSAVGQLISGVAHELNNPLTAILGYAQLLESEDLSDRTRDYVGKMFKQAQRTYRVVQNLLSFARQRKPAKMPCDVRKVVDDTLALRDYDMSLNNVKVERQYAQSLPPVVADPHQLEQVFLNIINNSVDAMVDLHRGGNLRVAIKAEGSNVSVEFHDSGPGIKELNRIFDPFYTTKSVGKGTGLGLSICYGIVKEHGGDIRAHNHAQGGAVVQVMLPATAAAQEETKRAAAAARVPLSGRVLLVDDEEVVLEFEKEVLAGAGADVICVTSVAAATTQLLKNSFDAVLVDSRMPGGDCRELHRWMTSNRPGQEQSIVVAVSDLNDAATRSFVEANGLTSINKPFEVAELIAVAGSIMRKKASAQKMGIS